MTEKITHIHKGHRERLRNKVNAHGLNGMVDHEVLEYLLSFVIPQKDTNPLAHELINKYGSLVNVFNADYNSLVSTKGVGNVVASFLSSMSKIIDYYNKNTTTKNDIINNTRDAVLYFKKLLTTKPIEELWLLCLDSSSRVKNIERISQGSINSTETRILEINKIINLNQCSNVIVAHNHPNGLSTPSIQDMNFTKALAYSITLNGVHLIDHIIIGENDYYSFAMNDNLQQFEDEINQLLGRNRLMQEKMKYNLLNEEN